MGKGNGTVANQQPPRKRPVIPSGSKETRPPAKRQRGPPKPGQKKLGRPKKVVPIPKITGLSSLPAEIIGRIASFLLPPNISVEDGFLAPWETPFGGHRTKCARARIREYKYGGIPSGVRDVLNLAVTCKRCDSGVGLVIGKIGDGKSDGIKRTMYITVPSEKDGSDPLRQRFVEESNMKQVYDRIKASSEVLERLVVHQCSHNSPTQNIPCKLDPFQTTATSFPNLEYLQLGPNLCDLCIRSLLHLFFSKEFTRAPKYSIYTGQLVSDSDDEDDINFTNHREAVWAPHGDPNRPGWMLNDPELKARFVDFDHIAAPNVVALQLFIPEKDSASGAKDYDILRNMLRHIPSSSSIRMFQLWLRENARWGGMGTSGTVNAYVCKDLKVVEGELTEWAKKEKEKSMTVQERLLAKFQADAAKVLPGKRKKQVVEVPDDESVDNKDDDEGTTPSEPDIKQEMSDVEAELNGGYGSDSEMGADSNGSKGPKMTNAERHAIYSHRYTVRQYEPILTSIAQAMPDLIGLSVLRQGTLMAEITQGARLLDAEADLWVEPLSKLQSLQYLDLGLAVSGIKEVSDFPLGLSIAQSRKGRTMAIAAGNDLQALKRRKYELDIKKAVEEGDKWRLEILKRFLIPKLVNPPQSLADAESTTGGSVTGTAAGGEDENEGSEVTWPKGLKSGYIYTADLVNRLRGNGLAIPWKVAGRTVQLGQPKRIQL